MKTSPLRTIERLSLTSLLFIFGCLGLSNADAASILFIVNSPDVSDPTSPSNDNDKEVAARLQSQGHTVTAADDQDPALGDLFAGKDLILISSSVGSGNQPLNSLSISTLRTGRIPIVNYEPGLYDELLFQRENTFGNAGGHTSLAISVANQSHPLAAGKSGTIDIVDPGNSAAIPRPRKPCARYVQYSSTASVGSSGRPSSATIRRSLMRVRSFPHEKVPDHQRIHP